MTDAIIRHKDKILYLVVGGWNTVFGYLSFMLLYQYLNNKIDATVILTMSYILSITNAFVGYKYFVFKTKGGGLREYFRFYIVYGWAYVANVLLLPLFLNVLKLSAYMSQAIITVMIVMMSYVFHKRFTFKAR
jgi:putative flippase GtrA